MLPRILSLGVAALDFWLLWSWDSAERDMIVNPAHPRSFFVICALIVLSMVLALVWFADGLADLEHQRQKWCPPALLKCAGWIFLLLPVFVFVWIRLTGR